MNLPFGDWQELSLRECVTKLVDGSHAPPPKANGGKPMLSARNIHNGAIVFDDYRLIEEGAFMEEDARTQVTAGDVLLTIVGSIGRSAVVHSEHPPFTLQRSVAVVTPKPSIDPTYLSYYFQSPAFQRWLLANAKGTAQKGIYLNTLGASTIRIPGLETQRRIVAKLDYLIARSKSARDELGSVARLIDCYKQAILASALRGDLTADWRSQQGVSLNEWSCVTIGEVTTDVRYGTAAKCSYEPKVTPVLRIPNVVNGHIDTDDVKYGSFSKRELDTLSLLSGDILVIRSNGSLNLVGRAAVVTDATAGYLYAGYLIRLRLDLLRVAPYFVLHALAAPAIRQEIESRAKSTSGVNNINSEQLKSLSLPMPPLAEQIEIACRVGEMFGRIEAMAREVSRARLLLDRFDQVTLAKAFHGELVPQDPNDQPVSIAPSEIPAEVRRTPERPPRSAKRRVTSKATKATGGAMPKRRADVGESYLTETLHALGGSAAARALWRRSEMDIDEFYKQLRNEIKAGRIEESPSKERLQLTHAA